MKLKQKVSFIVACAFAFPLAAQQQEGTPEFFPVDSPTQISLAWSHFFNIIGPHLGLEKQGHEKMGPLYLGSNFRQCEQEPENRALTPEESAAVIAAAASFQEAMARSLVKSIAENVVSPMPIVALVEAMKKTISSSAFLLIQKHVMKIASQVTVLSFMGDQISTYPGSAVQNGTGMYRAFGSIVGNFNFHRFSPLVKVVTPKNQTYIFNGTYTLQSGYGEVDIPFDATDQGNFSASVIWQAFCDKSNVHFTVAAYPAWLDSLSIRETYYKDSYIAGGTCQYFSLNCLPGTTPTCSFGWTTPIIPVLGLCPSGVRVDYLVVNARGCFWVGEYTITGSKPGACT